jgi:uncharacterized protein YkwD
MTLRTPIAPARVLSSIRRRYLLFLLFVVSPGCDISTPAVGAETSGMGTIEDQVAFLVNDYRQTIGCPRLAWNARLAEVARNHSADMLGRSYFGHQDPDGNDLADRLRAAGVRFRLAGENIAQGFRYENAARAVFEGWLGTEGHRKIIENCTFLQHGVGFVDFRWTHVFLR